MGSSPVPPTVSQFLAFPRRAVGYTFYWLPGEEVVFRIA